MCNAGMRPGQLADLYGNPCSHSPQVEPNLYSVTFIPVEGGGGRDTSRSPSAYSV